MPDSATTGSFQTTFDAEGERTISLELCHGEACSSRTVSVTVTVLTDRTTCDEISGTAYRSETERQWFLENCTGPRAASSGDGSAQHGQQSVASGSQPQVSGIRYEFGAGVSAADQQLVRDALGHAASYARSQLGAEVTNVLVAVNNDLDALAKAYAAHFRISEQVARSQIVTAVSGPRGLFIFTGSAGWTNGSDASRTSITVHEWFHILQNELSGPAGVIGSRRDDEVPVGGPRWLIEGSAVAFSNVVLKSLGGSFASWAAQSEAGLLSGAGRATHKLESTETWTGMLAAGAQRSYELGFAAARFLVQRSGLQAIVGHFRGIGSGLDWTAAFAQATGFEPAAFYEEFEAARQGPSSPVTPPTPSPPQTTEERPAVGISGTVRNSAGEPRAGIHVYGCPDPPGGCSHGITAVDGTYAISLASGTFRVQFGRSSDGGSPDGFYSSAGFVTSGGQATLVTVSSSLVTDINVTLPF